VSAALRSYEAVFQAALTGGESDIQEALKSLDESDLSRLRNVMHNIAELAEHRRKSLRRDRGLN